MRVTRGTEIKSKPARLSRSSTPPYLEFDAGIPGRLRSIALSRREFACARCGAAAGEKDAYDPLRPITLRIQRIIAKEEGGIDDVHNLEAVCSVCEEGARNLKLDRPPLRKVLIQVRRAAGTDQVEVLRWLVRKFPKQAQKLLKENAPIS